MAHITIITSGTRGDVEPFINFAISLKNLGFTVRLAAPIDFKEWILSHNLEYAKIGLEPIKTLLEATQQQDMLNFNLFKMRKILTFFKKHIRDVLITTLPHVADDTDLIISHVSLPASSDLAEAKDVPLIFVSTVPLAPTKLHPNIMMPQKFGLLSGRFYNKLTHLPVRFSRVFYSAIYKELRKKLNLPSNSMFTHSFKKAGTPVPLLHIYSSSLHPRPDDWPENAQIIGFSFNDYESQDWEPTPELIEFLEKGPPPIYIGFGSMIPRDEKELTNIICKAVEKANVRALISKGWANLTPNSKSENILPIGPMPHHSLFPHCKAVVHHGGAGTTAAGLRAACPTLICPFGFDQPFWGRVIYDRGLGPEPINLKDLTVENLATGLNLLNTSTEYKNNATRIALKLNQEDAFTNLMPYIERALNHTQKQKIQVE
jgi:sterol 3beta-glucosyltransferase